MQPQGDILEAVNEIQAPHNQPAIQPPNPPTTQPTTHPTTQPTTQQTKQTESVGIQRAGGDARSGKNVVSVVRFFFLPPLFWILQLLIQLRAHVVTKAQFFGGRLITSVKTEGTVEQTYPSPNGAMSLPNN